MPYSEEDLLKELMHTFQAEAVEHLQTLNQALLQLERAPEGKQRQTLLQDAFRAAHSLKGAARAVSLKDIEQLAHTMENVLQRARDANAFLDAATCDVLYDTLDGIETALRGDPVKLQALLDRLMAVNDPASMPDDSHPTGAAAAEHEGEAAVLTAGDDTIRVAISKLDNLMAQASELVISKMSAEQRLIDLQAVETRLSGLDRQWHELRAHLARLNSSAGSQVGEFVARHDAQLQELLHTFSMLGQAIKQDTNRLNMVTDSLQDEVRRVRMVPFQALSLSLERAAREAARREDKPIALHLKGSEVELDKKVLELLKDPLLHLLNNAISHGIEPAPVRQQRGKPAVGQIHITVRQRGNEIWIDVTDDGGGFDLDALRQASRSNGGPALDAEASAEEIINLAFLPGITTAKAITALAGRGVGLDVVRQHLAEIQGRINIESKAGRGSAFQLVVPVSLTIMRALLLQVGQEQYALPLLAVEKIVELAGAFPVEGRMMITVDDAPLPLAALDVLLERPRGSSAPQDQIVVVVAVAEQRLALLVDNVVAEQELAVKPLGKPLQEVRNVSGAALLGGGKPIIILNPADLIKSVRRADGAAFAWQQPEEGTERPPATILVVDDSITTRTLEKNILDAAGYTVLTAIDGIEALKRMGDHPVDVVVCDVQMPNMDGFEFTERLRQDNKYRGLPIILVTSLESGNDRERGMVAGADAYIVKRGFDQAELLATIERFLNQV